MVSQASAAQVTPDVEPPAPPIPMRLVVADLLEMALRQSGQRWPREAFESAVTGITEVAESHHFAPTLVLSLIQAESRFQLKATSPKGAVGLTQIMPSTAGTMARDMDMPATEELDLYDPGTNIRLGFAYLAALERQFGSLDAALAAYNAGPGIIRPGQGAALPMATYRREIWEGEGRFSQWLKKP